MIDNPPIINGVQLPRFGRKRPTQTPATHPHLFKCLDRYLTGAQLPTPPASFSYATKARAALADVLANDELGDCTSAAACHLEESISAAANAPVVLSRADAIKFYSLSTGYDPADPSTDQGGDEITVLNTWKKFGLDGKGSHAIVGYLSIPAHNAALVKAAMYLFESLYFGVELPDSYVNPFPSGDGFTWGTGTPNPNQGHAFCGVGADENGILIDTWGMLGTITYDAIAELASEAAGGNLFVVLTPEIIDRASGKSPNGFDWGQLIADLDSIGGDVPEPPAPSPGPAPSPTPTGAVSLAQAQAWARAGIDAGHALMTKSMASRAVDKALAEHWPTSS